MKGMEMMFEMVIKAMNLDPDAIKSQVNQALYHVQSIDEKLRIVMEQNARILQNQQAIMEKLEIVGNDNKILLLESTHQS